MCKWLPVAMGGIRHSWRAVWTEPAFGCHLCLAAKAAAYEKAAHSLAKNPVPTSVHCRIPEHVGAAEPGDAQMTEVELPAEEYK